MAEAKERCNSSCKTTCLQIIAQDHHKDGMGERENDTAEKPQRGHLHCKSLWLCYSRTAGFRWWCPWETGPYSSQRKPWWCPLKRKTPWCWRLQVLASKRTEMHPHTSLIHWMQKLACVLKLAGPETPLNQHALGGIKKRRKESWLPFQLFTHCSESAPQKHLLHQHSESA